MKKILKANLLILASAMTLMAAPSWASVTKSNNNENSNMKVLLVADNHMSQPQQNMNNQGNMPNAATLQPGQANVPPGPPPSPDANSTGVGPDPQPQFPSLTDQQPPQPFDQQQLQQGQMQNPPSDMPPPDVGY